MSDITYIIDNDGNLIARCYDRSMVAHDKRTVDVPPPDFNGPVRWDGEKWITGTPIPEGGAQFVQVT